MRLLLLTWRYLWWHPLRTLILCGGLAVAGALPLVVHRLIGQYEVALTTRSRTTPLVLGAKGSRYDLVLKALYFGNQQPTPMTMASVMAVRDTGWAQVLPLQLGFTARHQPLVGTSLEYFEFRGLHPAVGTLPLELGDAVLGADVARTLGLAPGSVLLTDQNDVYSLDAAYPLKLHVVGVLAPTGSPDDEAVFVDLKTTWIVAGIGHGHGDVVAAKVANDPAVVQSRSATEVVASEAVATYTEVTRENFASFHFHGDPDTFPVTAALVLPHDAKAATMLKGRLSLSTTDQLLVPGDVVAEMLGLVYRVQRYVSAIFVVVAATTVVFVALALWMSWRLREREMETLFRIGCSRGTIWFLRVSEGTMIAIAAVAMAVVFTLALSYLAPSLTEMF